jgi:hypothetical protein
MSIYNDAVNNWPEDEASLSASMAIEIYEEAGYEYYKDWVEKERWHFVKIFNDKALMDRFCAKFNSLTFEVTNLTI